MQSKKKPSICKSDWLQTMAMQIMAIQNGKKKNPRWHRLDDTGQVLVSDPSIPKTATNKEKHSQCLGLNNSNYGRKTRSLYG